MAERESNRSFGEVLRGKRVAGGFTLRRFAAAVGVSPTYLSQVEQDDAPPPTAERVAKMAELLGENPDALAALAGRVPGDLPGIIRSRPVQMPELLREASGLTADQLRQLVEKARSLKKKG